MGQVCACLQPRRKLERRASDVDTLHDTDGNEYDSDEIDIRIDNNSSSGADELDGLLGSNSINNNISSSSSWRSSGHGVFTKRSSKTLRLDATDSERTGSNANTTTAISTATHEVEDQLRRSSSSARLLGQTSDAAPTLSAEQNLDVLRSYQQVTGIVVDTSETDLECVMCLDTFTSTNPRVRTLCNCGMNRTNFHMSCLLEWKNRAAKCPVCREYLFYED